MRRDAADHPYDTGVAVIFLDDCLTHTTVIDTGADVYVDKRKSRGCFEEWTYATGNKVKTIEAAELIQKARKKVAELGRPLNDAENYDIVAACRCI
jgi:hypothetical protein